MLNKFFRYSRIIFICILSILSWHCSLAFNFDVNLDVHFNKNGSGTYSMIMNMEDLRSNISFGTFEKNEVVAYDYISGIVSDMAGRLKEKYKENKVKFVKGEKEQKFQLSFNFNSIDELNDILELMYGRKIFYYAYRTDRKTRERKFVLTNQIVPLKEIGLGDFIKNDDTKIKWFSIETMLSNTKIIRTYSFDEDIKRINSEKIEILREKKDDKPRTARIKTNLWKLTNPQNPSNKISYIMAFN